MGTLRSSSRGFVVWFLAVMLGAPLLAQPPAIVRCSTMDHLLWLQQQDPQILTAMQAIESQTLQWIAANPPGAGADVTYVIPVVVHVVYSNATQNVSDSQIQSQIQVLTLDFRRLNSDVGNTPAAFQAVAADTEFQFCLASVDPSGNATTGITRTQTTVTSFGTNNAVKNTATGGRSGWPSASYLNLWVCNLTGGLLGYAQFPGGPSSTDGVVIDYAYFGTTGTATSPFDLGRTATHEVGHWLNLYHIWGDNEPVCGDDLVSDTPQSNNFHYGCQSGIVSCGGTNMVENYMDYSDDVCMNLFTQGQKSRMRALFGSGGPRASLLSSTGCAGQSGCPAETGEPNDTCATASALTLATPVLRYVCPQYDADWYQVTLASSSSLTVTLTPPASPCTDYDVQLFGACGSFLGFSASAGCAVETLTTGTLAAGTYRVVVLGAGGASSSSATYTLNVASGPPPCPTESGEPNDTCTQATAITPGTTYNRWICGSTDVDWYQFTLATSQQVTVNLVPPQSPCLDFDLQLFSACGTFTGFSANSGCASESLNAGTLAAGTYRVVVIGRNGAFSSTVSYALSVTASAPPPSCSTETGEPNDTCTTSTQLNPGTQGGRYLCPQGDVDWYHFTLGVSQDVTLTLTPPSSPCLDYDLQLFSGCSTFIGYSAGAGCAVETLNAGTLAAGTYRVVVLSVAGDSSATAPYSLGLALSSPGPSCPAETGDPNDTCAQATAISTATTYNRYLCPQNDLDWYQFTLGVPTAVSITLTPPQSPCLDYDLQLFSSCGTFLGFSANSGCATETLSAGLLAAGTYRVVIIGSSGANSASATYSLRIN